jgi:hypothetical protein
VAVSAADLLAYVNGSATDNDFAEACLAEAIELVDLYVGTVVVPESIYDRAVKEVGSELFHRRQAPNGVAQFATPDAAPIRIARDPMVGAYPILNRVPGLGVGIA